MNSSRSRGGSSRLDPSEKPSYRPSWVNHQLDTVDSDDSLWTVRDVAVWLNVPVDTVYEWRRKRRSGDAAGPPCARVGKHVRYHPDDVRRWFAQLVTEQKEKGHGNRR